MGRPEIIEKLDGLFMTHMPFTEECHVVYLLVEIRKILDRENDKKYPLLKFYADWSVHTKKDHITNEIRGIMNTLFKGISDHIRHGGDVHLEKVVQFIYFENLRIEMRDFLREYTLNTIITYRNNWLIFITLFTGILVNQPIVKPCLDIKRFEFDLAAKGSVTARITFTKDINGNHYFEFKNAY